MQTRLYKLANFFVLLLSIILLDSCSTLNSAGDKFGFRFRNYFLNDSNKDNKKYDNNFDPALRRQPIGNKEGDGSIIHIDRSQRSYYNFNKKDSKASDVDNRFWDKYYGANEINKKHGPYKATMKYGYYDDDMLADDENLSSDGVNVDLNKIEVLEEVNFKKSNKNNYQYRYKKYK
jgi:hypothetical protein